MSELDRSALYVELAPRVLSQTVTIPNDPTLVRELRGSERRRGAGRDRVDHRPGAHDDAANALAGAVRLVGARPHIVPMARIGGGASEMLRAVGPTLATTGGRLIILSSPYAHESALRESKIPMKCSHHHGPTLTASMDKLGMPAKTRARLRSYGAAYRPADYIAAGAGADPHHSRLSRRGSRWRTALVGSRRRPHGASTRCVMTPIETALGVCDRA